MAIEEAGVQLPYMDIEHVKSSGDIMETTHVKAFEALQNIADRLPEDQVVGQILSWPVADGRAYYMVTKENPLTVAHIDYLDAWRIDPIMIKGLDVDDVREKVQQRRALLALFGERHGDEPAKK